MRTNELPLITNLTEQLKLDAEVYKIRHRTTGYQASYHT